MNVRPLAAIAGVVLVILGVVVLPASVMSLASIWASQFLTFVGWMILVASGGPLVDRLMRPAMWVSGITSVAVGFGMVLGVPIAGDLAPRTLGLAAVLLGLTAIGWTVTRVLGTGTQIMAAAIAGLALLGEFTVVASSFVFQGPALEANVGLDSALLNASRWATLSLCAFGVVLVGLRRRSRSGSA